MKEGDCLRNPPDEAGAYQHWAKHGMTGILTCQADSVNSYEVAWSIDQLRITGSRVMNDQNYKDALAEFLKIRDQIK